MFKFFQRKNRKISKEGISVISLLIFYIYNVIIAKYIYFQFSIYEIFIVSFLFLGILIGLSKIFLPNFNSFILSFKEFLISIPISFILIMFSNNPHFYIFDFFNPLILHEAETGTRWNPDTAFNISLIQSILQFGYPSVAQHGHPITNYHTLSFYFDALILKVSNLDPFESYGLLFHFKYFAWISAILLTICSITRRQSTLTFIFSFLFLTPLLLGNGLGIGSHSQWMPSIIIVFSGSYIFHLILLKRNVGYSSLIPIFIVIVIISVGKISMGLMLASVIGILLFLNGFKNVSIYIFGVLLLLFFYIFGSSFSLGDGSKQTFDISLINIKSYIKYYSGIPLYPNAPIITKSILAEVFTLGIIYYFNTNRIIGYAFLSSLASTIIIYIVTTAKIGFNPSDIAYFQYGLNTVLLLLTFIIIMQYFKSLVNNISSLSQLILFAIYFKKIRNVYSALQKFKFTFQTRIFSSSLIIIFIAMIARSNFMIPSYNFFYLNLDSVRAGFYFLETRFDYINKKLPTELQLSLKALFFESSKDLKTKALSTLSLNRPLYSLNQKIKKELLERKINKDKVAMFIPNEIFDESQKRFGGYDWAQSLLFYAITGIQLVHGVQKRPEAYGFPTYYDNPNAQRISRKHFLLEKNCHSLDLNYILVIKSLDPPDIIIANCNIN